jgi:hypothetical protein
MIDSTQLSWSSFGPVHSPLAPLPTSFSLPSATLLLIWVLKLYRAQLSCCFLSEAFLDPSVRVTFPSYKLSQDCYPLRSLATVSGFISFKFIFCSVLLLLGRLSHRLGLSDSCLPSIGWVLAQSKHSITCTEWLNEFECVCVCVCPSPIPRRARNSHSEIFRNFCHMLVWVLLISISELMENPVSLSLLGVHCGDSSMMRLPHTFLGYLWNKSVPYLWVVCILLSGFSLKDLENGNCLLITVLETSPFTFHNSEWCDSWFKKQIIEILENIWWYKEWIL